MTSALVKLLTLIALVLMPISMTGMPADAHQMPASHESMAMGHCDGKPADPQSPAPTPMDCQAMCAAIPVADCPMPMSTPKPAMQLNAAIAAPFAGIEPEIATPPPRRR